jgi:hypothetical protein
MLFSFLLVKKKEFYEFNVRGDGFFLVQKDRTTNRTNNNKQEPSTHFTKCPCLLAYTNRVCHTRGIAITQDSRKATMGDREEALPEAKGAPK